MAVYTHISDEDLIQYLEGFNLGNIISLESITEGIDNTNYKLTTSSGDYILTIFEERINEEDLPFYMGLMQHFHDKGIPCPDVVRNKDGKMFSPIDDKLSAVVTFMAGEHAKNINNHHVKSIGKTLGKMHIAVDGFEMQRESSVSLSACKKLIDDCARFLKQEDPEFLDLLNKELAYQETHYNKYVADLPKGAIHGDLFPDNVFFNNLEEVSAVFDFYFACTDYFVYGLMLTINAWCFNKEGALDIEKQGILLDAYKKERELSDTEKETMQFFGRVAALRILSTRLYDWHHPREDAIVKPHDPMDYLNILKFYQNEAV